MRLTQLMRKPSVGGIAARLALFAATLVLAGCGGQPQVTVTVTSPPASTTAPVETSPAAESSDGLEVCRYGVMPDTTFYLVMSAWDMVKASRGAADHAKRVEGLVEAIDDAIHDQAPDPCLGGVESAKLAFEVSLLNAKVVISDDAEDADYEAVMAAGNEWLDAVGHTKHRFTMGENDSGV